MLLNIVRCTGCPLLLKNRIICSAVSVVQRSRNPGSVDLNFNEKEKGFASDSFKRVCFNWGIGRELYTAPFIYVPADKMTIHEKNGKCATYDKFIVEKGGLSDGKLCLIRNVQVVIGQGGDAAASGGPG